MFNHAIGKGILLIDFENEGTRIYIDGAIAEVLVIPKLDSHFRIPMRTVIAPNAGGGEYYSCYIIYSYYCLNDP